MGLPLIVGEFAAMGLECVAYIDYGAILDECQRHSIGWLAWSWGQVDNGDCAEMSMTTDGTFGNWRDTSQGRWGEETVVTHANSIQNTSVTPASLQ